MTDKGKLQTIVARCQKEAAARHKERETLEAELATLDAKRPGLLRGLLTNKSTDNEVTKHDAKAGEIRHRLEAVALAQTDLAEERDAATAALREIEAEEARLERLRLERELEERQLADAAEVVEATLRLVLARGKFLVDASEFDGVNHARNQQIAQQLVDNDPQKALVAAGAREVILPGNPASGVWQISVFVEADPVHAWPGNSLVLEAGIVRQSRIEAAPAEQSAPVA
jgi:hypothetical protein